MASHPECGSRNGLFVDFVTLLKKYRMWKTDFLNLHSFNNGNGSESSTSLYIVTLDMLKLYVSLCSSFSFMLGQLCACALVRLRYENHQEKIKFCLVQPSPQEKMFVGNISANS